MGSVGPDASDLPHLPIKKDLSQSWIKRQDRAKVCSANDVLRSRYLSALELRSKLLSPCLKAARVVV